MTRKEERRVLHNIEVLREEIHENNHMLRQIIKVINTHLSRFHQENADDFERNVLANLISGGIRM